MKKRRISTTISTKHWDILKKHSEKHESQQKALELAIESLENNSIKTNSLLLEQEQVHPMFKEKQFLCHINRDQLRLFFEKMDVGAVIKEFKKEKYSVNFTIMQCQKPLKNCSLKEVIDAAVYLINYSNTAESIEYTDEGTHYFLKIFHNMSMNYSTATRALIETVFEAFGARIESEIYENSLFVMIYK